MNRLELKDGSIIETFRDFSEFFDTCDSRKINFGDARTRFDDDDGWAGASYDQARDMMLHGYDKSVKAVNSRVSTLQKQAFEKPPRRIRDYAGFAPIVPNVVLGLPKTMWNNKTVARQFKVVTVCYDAGVSCCVSKEQLEEHGAKVVSYIMNLERLGYRVRIDAIVGFMGGSFGYAVRVPIKNEHNPINLKRIAFPTTHVAYLRTLGFDWYERLPKAERLGGYGTPLYALSDEDRKDFLGNILSKGEYYINYELDPEDVFKEFAEELK